MSTSDTIRLRNPQNRRHEHREKRERREGGHREQRERGGRTSGKEREKGNFSLFPSFFFPFFLPFFLLFPFFLPFFLPFFSFFFFLPCISCWFKDRSGFIGGSDNKVGDFYTQNSCFLKILF